jgi:hypothetical protein
MLIDEAVTEIQEEGMTLLKETQENNSKELPLSVDKFLEHYSEKLFNFEVEELKKYKIDKVYFTGLALTRTDTELALFKGENE